jgi:hypothetical protein
LAGASLTKIDKVLKHFRQMNGVKPADSDAKFANDNDVGGEKTSNVISVDSSDDDKDDILKNGGKKLSTRKRSTAEDDATSMDLKVDALEDDVVSDGVDNGESQAKRPKSTQNKDW